MMDIPPHPLTPWPRCFGRGRPALALYVQSLGSGLAPDTHAADQVEILTMLLRLEALEKLAEHLKHNHNLSLFVLKWNWALGTNCGNYIAEGIAASASLTQVLAF